MIHNFYQNPKYTLDVISHHPQFGGQTLRKHSVDGIETVGAWGNEPFEIRFKNNTWNKVQIKISVDGLDILSGELADTQVSKDMWVVQGYGTLSLKAWPETSKGGAAFVFTTADNSVANHIQGDLSNRGIIAAAVFIEGYVAPQRILQSNYWNNSGSAAGSDGRDNTKSARSMRRAKIQTQGLDSAKGGTGILSLYDADYSCDSIVTNNVFSSNTVSEISDFDCERSFEKLVAVGAGEQVNQNITYVTGLTKPVFSESVRVRYLWWDDLVKKLSVPADPHPTGFPGDQGRQIMSLGDTPRLDAPKKPKSKVKRSSAPSRF